MPRISNTEPFGTPRSQIRWTPMDSPTPAEERAYELLMDGAACDCCGDRFMRDELVLVDGDLECVRCHAAIGEGA